MDRRDRNKPPRAGLVWSERHGLWIDPDGRTPERRTRDERVLAAAGADQDRIRAALRRAEQAQQEQQTAVATAATAVAKNLLASLIEVRSRQGLSQAEVARRLGVPPSVIARLEAGTHSPTLGTLSRYAAAVGATRVLVS